MKNTLLAPFAAFALMACLATEAAAQMAVANESIPTGGLLGQNYAGVDVGYIRHHEGPPRVMHRYGFHASRPMPEKENIDGFFRYNYTHGSNLGIDTNQHDILAGLVGFRRNGPVAPFLEGGLGWAWSEVGSTPSNSFLYAIRLGVEFLVAPNASLTPTVTFREARRFDDRAFLFGAKAAFRLNRDWGATISIQADDADSHNIEWALGVQRRF
jgi:hypothetical protein